MALQVWLPLNGDLHNQGLKKYNLSMFRGTEVYNNNGKIGKCFYANGVNTIKILNIIPDFYNYTSYSLCAWFYIEEQNTSHSGSAIISAGNWNNQVLNLSVSDWSSDHYTRLRISGTNWNNTYTYNFQKNIWYHVVVSSDGNKTYAYVNGVLLGNTASGFLPTNIEGTDMCIGGATYYAGMQFFGRINDVRIYNHYLSPEEVKEISKGLVIHYKLNQENSNLLSKYVVPGQASPGSTATGGRTIFNGNYSVIIPASENADTYFRLFLKQQLIENEIYTISCYVSGLKQGTYYRFPLFAQNNTSMGVLSLDHNGLCSLVFTMNNSTQTAITTPEGDTVYICFMDDSGRSLATGQGQIILSGFKLEKGNQVTSGVQSDPITKIYDSSGYNNNGTVVGSLNAITPSPKYSCATFFDNKEYIIHKLPENMYQATYSFWIKASSYTNYGAVYMPYQSPSAGTSPWFAINTESCKVWAYFGNNSPNYTKGSGTMPLNEWHHCVYVWDNGVAQWYVDGEKSGNSVTYTGRTFIQNTTNATIGNSYTGTSWGGTPFTGEISDFRIYATALNENDIKELYKTSMIINSSLILPRGLE